VTLTESGLPAGTLWLENITGRLADGIQTGLLTPTSSGASMSLPLPNGSFTYRSGTADKSYAASGGSFTVAGGPAAVGVTFILQKFTVTFTEGGIPSKTLAKFGWTIWVNGTEEHGSSSSLSFSGIPNGSYPVLATGPSGYATTESGSVAVSGATAVAIPFTSGKTATLTFTESGLPKLQRWCMAVDGAPMCTTTSDGKYLNLSSGTYTYSVLSPLAGQNITQVIGKTVTYGPSGSIALTGSTTVRLTFGYVYAVTFTETGLTCPAPPKGGGGSCWSVTIKGVTRTSWNTTIIFDLKNGTYGFKVGAVSGYTSVGSPKKAAVNGASVTLTVTFTAKAKKAVPPGLLELLPAAAVVPASWRRGGPPR